MIDNLRAHFGDKAPVSGGLPWFGWKFVGEIRLLCWWTPCFHTFRNDPPRWPYIVDDIPNKSIPEVKSNPSNISWVSISLPLNIVVDIIWYPHIITIQLVKQNPSIPELDAGKNHVFRFWFSLKPIHGISLLWTIPSISLWYPNYTHTYRQTDQTRPYQTIPDHTRT